MTSQEKETGQWWSQEAGGSNVFFWGSKNSLQRLGNNMGE